MHVAITGASAGIGEALVRAYARRGAGVTLVARRKERLSEIAREVGGKTFVAPADLAELICRAVERRKARIIYPRAYGVALWFPRVARWFTARFSPPLQRARPVE